MNRLLQRYAHNILIDQVLFWSANRREIARIVPEPMHQDGSRILIQFQDGESEAFELPVGAFGEIWNEARIVLATATSIPSEFRALSDLELNALEPARRTLDTERAELLTERVTRELTQSTNEVMELFREGLYEMFLDETGVVIKEPSDTLKAKIGYALKKQEAQQDAS